MPRPPRGSRPPLTRFDVTPLIAIKASRMPTGPAGRFCEQGPTQKRLVCVSCPSPRGYVHRQVLAPQQKWSVSVNLRSERWPVPDHSLVSHIDYNFIVGRSVIQFNCCELLFVHKFS